MGRVRIEIERRDRPDGAPYRQAFEVDERPGMTLLGALRAIERNPVTAEGETVPPVAFEGTCGEGFCGACTAVVNGQARPMCSTLLVDLVRPIQVEPLTKFPVVRDLAVDFRRSFEIRRTMRTWIDIDGFADAPAPPVERAAAEAAYAHAVCTACGACLEACPNVQLADPARNILPRNPYAGPEAMNEVALTGFHPTGRAGAPSRVERAMGPEGITGCGGAENCVEACPQRIPLVRALALVDRMATRMALRHLLGFE